MMLHADDFVLNFLSALEDRHNFLLPLFASTQVLDSVQKTKYTIWNQFLRVEVQERAGAKNSLLLLYQSPETDINGAGDLQRNPNEKCLVSDLTHSKSIFSSTIMWHLFLRLWEVSCFVVCDHRTMFEQFRGSQEYILRNVFLSFPSPNEVTPMCDISDILCIPIEIQSRIAERFNGWLRQEGVKDMRKTLILMLNRLSEGKEKDDQPTRLCMIQEVCNKLLGLLYEFTIKCISYQGRRTTRDLLPGQDSDKDIDTNSSHADKRSKSVELPGYPLIRIKECSLAPITLSGSLMEEKEHKVDGGRGTISGSKQVPPDEILEGSLMLAPSTTIAAHSKVCMSSSSSLNSIILPPFSELLRVPRDELFHIHTVKEFSPWMKQIVSSNVALGMDDGRVLPLLGSLIEDDETRLILTFTYESKRQEVERFVWNIMRDVIEGGINAEVNEVKHDDCSHIIESRPSHWELLLRRIPVAYPTVPTFWSVSETVHLLGTNLLDEVMTKKANLSEFTTSVREAVWAAFGLEIPCEEDDTDDLEDQEACDHYRINAILKKGITKSTTDNDNNSELSEYHKELLSVLFPALSDRTSSIISLFSPSSVLSALLSCIFTEETIHWARATFDSRAFNLNVNGEVLLVLSPVADMINHCGDNTDVLVRRIDDESGDFVMESAGLIDRQECSENEELMMGYGPLQNWELLLSYGFGIYTADPERGSGLLPFLLGKIDCSSASMQPMGYALRELLYIGNHYDRLPLPVDLSNQDDGSGTLDAIYAAKRHMIIEKHGLNVGNDVWLGPASDESLMVLPVSHDEEDPEGHECMYKVYEWDLSVEQWAYLSTIPSPSAAAAGLTNLAELLREERRHRGRILLRPSPAALAVLRLSHADIGEYEQLEKDPFTQVTPATERRAVETLREALCATLVEFGDSDLTVEAIVAKSLQTSLSVKDRNPNSDNKNFDTDNDDESTQEAVISPFRSVNERLALQCIRLPLISMIWASLRWCCYTLDNGDEITHSNGSVAITAEEYFDQFYQQQFRHEEDEEN